MEKIRDLVKAMLRKGLVEGILAPVKGLSEVDILPAFITEESEADRIVLDTYYPFSLAKMVAAQIGKGTRIGILVTTCDARALVELAKREQVDLEQVYIIGVECGEGKFLLPWCQRCEFLVPSMADIAFYRDGTVSANSEKGKELVSLINVTVVAKRETPEEVRERATKRQEDDFAELARLKPEEKLRYWFRYFDRCIKCYGCRNACPICFCKDCYLEPHKLVVQSGGNPPDKLFHLTRLMHVSDSCVNCGRCEANCPMGVPISRLYHQLHKELSIVFDYEAGFDLTSLPPLGMITEEEMRKTEVEIA